MKWTKETLDARLKAERAEKREHNATRRRDYSIFFVHRDGTKTPDSMAGRGPLKAAVSWANRHAQTIEDADIVSILIEPNVAPDDATGGLESIVVATRWGDPLNIKIEGADMANVDIDKLIDGLNSAQIDDLVSRATAAKAAKRKAEITSAKEAVDQLLAERGLTFREVFVLGERSQPDDKKGGAAKAEPTHRDPTNPDNIWRGRGKRPEWLNTYLADGRSVDEFKIAKD